MHPYYEIRESDKSNHFAIFTVESLTFPAHLHSYVELIYVLNGSVEVSINENDKELRQGDIGVVFPNDVHSYNSNESSRSIVLIFSPELIGGYFSGMVNKTLETPFFLKGSFDESIITLLSMLLVEAKNDNEYVVKGFLYSIFGKLNVSFIFRECMHMYDTTIQKLLKYIGTHFMENITLENTAKELGYSKFHISRVLNNKIGEQFNNYVNRLRINAAEILLVETDMTISNIALECGFESIRNFNRVFKGQVGYTPSSYRNQYKK